MARIAEWLVGLLALAASALILVESLRLPRIAADPAGLALMPQIFALITGGAALVLIAALAGRALSRPRRAAAANPPPVASAEPLAPAALRDLTLVGACTVAYPVVMSRIGFLLATMVFVGSVLLVLRARPLPAALLTIVCSVLLYFAFGSLLGAHLPPGAWLAAIFN